jgi:low affinity Fe/Cu permease
LVDKGAVHTVAASFSASNASMACSQVGKPCCVLKSRLDGISKALERFAVWTTNWVGSSWAFMIAFAITLLWLITGPLFGFTDTWQLVMNTISSIVTFLMVFLLQRSQNKESLAMQVKLNELLAANRGASNRLINVENLSEEEVRDLHRRYQQIVAGQEAAGTLRSSCSIEQVVKPGELGAGAA